MDPKKIDWANLGFDLIPTAAHIECVYSNGEWDPTGGRLVVKPEISMHIAGAL